MSYFWPGGQDTELLLTHPQTETINPHIKGQWEGQPNIRERQRLKSLSIYATGM